MEWTIGLGAFEPQLLVDQNFLETYDSATASQQWVRVLQPENLVRGQITNMRIVGMTYMLASRLGATNNPGDVYPDPNEIPGGGIAAGIPIWEGIQLVPVVDGGIDTNVNQNSFLQLANTANQENPRILWQRYRVLDRGLHDADTQGLAQAVFRWQSCYADCVVDVKSKRRWARSAWAMYYTLEFLPQFSQPEERIFLGGYTRHLMKAADSI